MEFDETYRDVPEFRRVIKATFGRPIDGKINFSLKPLDDDCLASIPSDIRWTNHPLVKHTIEKITFVLPDQVFIDAVKPSRMIGTTEGGFAHYKLPPQQTGETILDAIKRLEIDRSKPLYIIKTQYVQEHNPAFDQYNVTIYKP